MHKSQAGGRGRRDAGKERQWRGLITEQRQSGESVRAFCRSRELREASFYHWRQKIERRDREVHVTRSAASALAPVVVVDVPSGDAKSSAVSATIEIVFSGGTIVRVPSGSTSEQLGMVFDTLERSRC